MASVSHLSYSLSPDPPLPALVHERFPLTVIMHTNSDAVEEGEVSFSLTYPTPVSASMIER